MNPWHYSTSSDSVLEYSTCKTAQLCIVNNLAQIKSHDSAMFALNEKKKIYLSFLKKCDELAKKTAKGNENHLLAGEVSIAMTSIASTIGTN